MEGNKANYPGDIVQAKRINSRTKGTYNEEALEELIESLLEASSHGAAIIVEGMRDRDSLRALGVKGPIMMASQKPLLYLAEDIAADHREIIILTDWDEKGEEMAVDLAKHLSCIGSRGDIEIRSRLKRLVKKEIKDVESLSRYIEKMRELYGT
jgi:5S rRNA maturation endonuclease (ribonuclease M5)